jgi:sterol desaturase/sphingolipid hydroxylase (fatty acid hydroxylase superfamily)
MLAPFTAPSIAALLASWGAFFLVVHALASGVGFLLERSAFGLRRRIFDVPLARNQLRRELIGGVMFDVVATIVFALAIDLGAIRFGPTTWKSALLTYGVAYVGFEAWFYAMHRALHARSLVRFHRWHHASHVTTPLTGVSMGPVEAMGWAIGWLFFPALLSRVMPLSIEIWLAYMLIQHFGNIFGHVNVEVFGRATAKRAASWHVHPFTFHALHHARWTEHFGYTTTVLDRLLGTESRDWPALFLRVIDGKAMRSLKERA